MVLRQVGQLLGQTLWRCNVFSFFLKVLLANVLPHSQRTLHSLFCKRSQMTAP